MKRQIVYLHIPKSGGTTLFDIVRRQYPKKRLYKLRSRVAKSDWSEFLMQSPCAKHEFDAFYGHFEYGLHRELLCQTRYVAMLREPVARVISLHRYLMDRPESSFWDKSPKQGLTIMEFVEGGYSKSACNGQTRVLTGQLGADSMREDSLELAIENVSKDFQAVGIMERFDESLVYFRAKLDWKSHCCYVQKNVSKRRDMTVTQSDIDTIRRHNRLDIELYDYVQREFQDQLNLACENSERSLFLHRQCNRFYPFVNKIGSGVLDVMRAVKRQVREVGGV